MAALLKKVLVVDDDPVVARSFDRVLSGKGYAVITARNGEEALERLAAEDYDVVYTDIRMPGVDGLEVAERMKERRPWMPVVIITGYGTEANEKRAREAGVAGFLRKPLSPDMIEASAHDALSIAPPVSEAAAALAAVAPAAPAKARPNALLAARNVALFFAAPFIALAYILAFPFVGAGMLAWFGWKAAKEHGVGRKIAGPLKTAGIVVAAPFIGLAYAVVGPFVGLGMLAWIGARALVKRGPAE